MLGLKVSLPVRPLGSSKSADFFSSKSIWLAYEIIQYQKKGNKESTQYIQRILTQVTCTSTMPAPPSEKCRGIHHEILDSSDIINLAVEKLAILKSTIDCYNSSSIAFQLPFQLRGIAKNMQLKSSCFPNQMIVEFLYNATLRVVPCFPPLETYIRFDLGNNPITCLGSSLQ